MRQKARLRPEVRIQDPGDLVCQGAISQGLASRPQPGMELDTAGPKEATGWACPLLTGLMEPQGGGAGALGSWPGYKWGAVLSPLLIGAGWACTPNTTLTRPSLP